MNATGQAASSNFTFLAKRYPQLERIGALGERYFSDDPIVSLIRVRQFGEALAQLVAARSGLFADADEPQADLLRRHGDPIFTYSYRQAAPLLAVRRKP